MGVRKEIIASKSKATLTFLHNSYGDPDHVPEPGKSLDSKTVAGVEFPELGCPSILYWGRPGWPGSTVFIFSPLCWKRLANVQSHRAFTRGHHADGSYEGLLSQHPSSRLQLIPAIRLWSGEVNSMHFPPSFAGVSRSCSSCC